MYATVLFSLLSRASAVVLPAGYGSLRSHRRYRDDYDAAASAVRINQR